MRISALAMSSNLRGFSCWIFKMAGVSKLGQTDLIPKSPLEALGFLEFHKAVNIGDAASRLLVVMLILTYHLFLLCCCVFWSLWQEQ